MGVSGGGVNGSVQVFELDVTGGLGVGEVEADPLRLRPVGLSGVPDGDIDGGAALTPKPKQGLSITGKAAVLGAFGDIFQDALRRRPLAWQSGQDGRGGCSSRRDGGRGNRSGDHRGRVEGELLLVEHAAGLGAILPDAQQAAGLSISSNGGQAGKQRVGRHASQGV